MSEDKWDENPTKGDSSFGNANGTFNDADNLQESGGGDGSGGDGLTITGDYMDQDTNGTTSTIQADDSGTHQPVSSPSSAGISLCTKILICVPSLTIIISFLFGIYFFVNFAKFKHCLVCTETDVEFSIIAPFLWWSNWALITTTITWTVWVWHKVTKNVSSLFLIELSLPLSIFVMIGYTLYLGTSGWGEDFVDTEMCHRFFDLYIPKEAAQVKQNVYFSMAFITTTCIHYICAIINVVLYINYYTRKAWKPILPIGFITLISSIVVLAQGVGLSVVYCTDKVHIGAIIAVIACTIMHALFFHPSLPCKAV